VKGIYAVPVPEGQLVGLRVPNRDPVPVEHFKGDFGNGPAWLTSIGSQLD
jgi:hypothetical protein